MARSLDIQAATVYLQRCGRWKTITHVTIGSQVWLLAMAGLVQLVQRTGALSLASALILSASVAWITRLIVAPAETWKFYSARHRVLESDGWRYMMRSDDQFGRSRRGQFPLLATAHEQRVAKASSVDNGAGVLPAQQYEVTDAMEELRGKSLPERIEAYSRRLVSLRQEYLELLSSRWRRRQVWVGIGILAEILAIGAAIWQLSGGPENLIPVLGLIAASSMGWVEGSTVDSPESLKAALSDLDSAIGHLNETHTHLSWSRFVSSTENFVAPSNISDPPQPVVSLGL